MTWRRTVLGPPGRNLGGGRWPVTSFLAVVVAIFAAVSGDWWLAILAGALAVLLGGLTLRAARRR